LCISARKTIGFYTLKFTHHIVAAVCWLCRSTSCIVF